jgi:uncharacterized phage protein (TIGR02220 family)
MKRFTDTNKWRDPWFLSLSPDYKLMWIYLCDCCDIAGFWPVCPKLMAYETGIKDLDWNGFVLAAGDDRLRIIGDKAWIVKFVQFQFPKGLHPRDCARVAIQRLLIKAKREDLLRGLVEPNNIIIHSLLEGAYRELGRSYHVEGPWKEPPRSLQAPQEKEKEKEPERRGGAGGEDCRQYSTESRVALHWLNQESGRIFRETSTSLSPINARLIEKDVDIEGVKQMISRQCKLWKGTKLEEYLRPSTLFGKEKFNEYYANRNQPIIQDGKQNPRNTGTIAGPTDYSKAKPRLQREIGSKGAEMAGQMALPSTSS